VAARSSPGIQRSYEREAVVFDPLHYLALLEQKTRALDQAAPLAGWQLPECFAQLRRCWKRGSRSTAAASMCRCCADGDLRHREVTRAVEDALLLGTISFDAVRICCCAASNEDRRGWTWRTIRTCRWHRYAPRRPPTT
jgi:hypothetical protein